MFCNYGRIRRFLRVAGVLVVLRWCASAEANVSWNKTVTDVPSPANFDSATNWTLGGTPIPGEQTPPGKNPVGGMSLDGTGGTWFIEGGAANTTATPPTPARAGYNGTILLDSARDGSDAAHPKLGSGAIGGGIADEVATLIISANVTFTGVEHNADGTVSGTTRNLRLGQSDFTPMSGGNFQMPWGVVKQTHGTVLLEMAASHANADLKIADDKSDANLDSAGGIWEVGGDASLMLPWAAASDLQLGDKVGVRAPGAIFRVRGSHVGTIEIGDRFQIQSQTAAWDVSSVDLGAGPRDKLNRGKSIVEFVLDSGGVGPIQVDDEMRLGSLATAITDPVNEPLGHSAFMLAFLRVKLSEPTTKGSGNYDPLNPGNGDVITLIKADRITSGITTSGTELDQGRFFDPDRVSDSGTAPHKSLLDGQTLKSDYAGATYNWTIHYFESSGGSQDMLVDPAVVLSNLTVTGTPGDLNHDTVLDSLDRTALQAAIAAPPVIAINGAQSLYDLNADGLVDAADLTEFNTIFLPPVGIPGDYNGNGIVDTADYTVWRDHLGQTFSLQNRDTANNGVISQADYTSWVTNFGNHGAGAGLGSGGAVPEPCTLVLALVGLIGWAAYRRRIA